MVSMGEESLMRKEVNLIFRLEKLAGSLGEMLTISDAANAELAGTLSTQSLGLHTLKGFE